MLLKVIHTLECGSFLVNTIAFSSDGKLFAAASDNGTIRLWHANGTLQQTLNGPYKPVHTLIFSPNSTLLSSVSGDDDDDAALRLWKVDDGTMLKKVAGHFDPVTFSPNGALASGSSTGIIKLWALAQVQLFTLERFKYPPLVPLPRSKMLQPMLNRYPQISALAFSPNGSLLACGYDNGNLKLWDMSSEYADDYYPCHEGSVTALAFSQDGEKMASASFDGTIMIKLWDTIQAQHIIRLKESSGIVYCLEFSPDRKILTSVSSDRHIRLWDMAQRKLLFEIKAAGRISTLSFSLCYIRVGIVNDQTQGPYSIKICDITI